MEIEQDDDNLTKDIDLLKEFLASDFNVDLKVTDDIEANDFEISELPKDKTITKNKLLKFVTEDEELENQKQSKDKNEQQVKSENRRVFYLL